jgi:hypothetical protein
MRRSYDGHLGDERFADPYDAAGRGLRHSWDGGAGYGRGGGYGGYPQQQQYPQRFPQYPQYPQCVPPAREPSQPLVLNPALSMLSGPAEPPG